MMNDKENRVTSNINTAANANDGDDEHEHHEVGGNKSIGRRPAPVLSITDNSMAVMDSLANDDDDDLFNNHSKEIDDENITQTKSSSPSLTIYDDTDLLMVSPPPPQMQQRRNYHQYFNSAINHHTTTTTTTTTTTPMLLSTASKTRPNNSFLSPSSSSSENNNSMMMISPPPPPNSEYLRDTIQRIGQTLDTEIDEVMEMIIHGESNATSSAAVGMSRNAGLLNDTDDDDSDDFSEGNDDSLASVNLRRRIIMDDDDDEEKSIISNKNNNNLKSSSSALKSSSVDDAQCANEEAKEADDMLNFSRLTLEGDADDDDDADYDSNSYNDDDESEYVDDDDKGRNADTSFVFDDEVSINSSSNSCSSGGSSSSTVDKSVTCFDSCGCWELDEGGRDFILPSSSSSSSDTTIHTNNSTVQWPKVRLPLPLYNKLFQHQRIGVQWMASLHNTKIQGGILADDMGMGKTMSTLSYLGSLMRARTICNAIVVCPKSVVRSWEREANLIVKNMCVKKATVYAVTSDMKSERRKRIFTEAFCSSAEAPRLVVTTYGLVSNHITDLTRMAETFPEYHWCYVVLDEGHVVKNCKTRTSQDVRILSSRSEKTRRLLLTGTPIQNNMRELHALFDWATSSQLLGSIKTFLNQYGDPIEDGRQRNASAWAIKKAAEMNVKLQKVIQPYFLQRLKETEFEDTMPKKKELVVFTRLSSKQRRMYEHFTEHQVFDGGTSSPLAAISWLKMLCGHPSLVKDANGRYKEYDDVDLLVKDSTKLQVLIALIHRLKRSGHRALVFSQSTKMLDIMERALPGSIRHLRIDGTTAEKSRQKFVDHFNDSNSGIDIMLLSTKAAGVGITLTGASRAIIYDPSWTPAVDSQAVDRCYRIGQTKDVTVYRLISAGTVEEKMYEKQVYKDGIKRVVLSNAGATARYFDHAELKDLFKLAPEGVSATLEKFNKKSDNNAAESSGKQSFLTKHPMVIGVASHDVLYSTIEIDVDDDAPFSRLPYQKTGGIRKGVTPLNAQIDLTIDDDSPDLKPLRGGLNRTKQRIEDAKEAKRAEAMTKKVQNTSHVGKILREADSLIENRKYGEALDVLLSSIEGDFALLQGDDKLAIHAKVAQVAGQLGWL